MFLVKAHYSPALLSNPALRRQQASILTDWFSNGDGCLVVRTNKLQASGHRNKEVDSSEWCYLRLLLTDSGHYLLPVDDCRELSKETVNDVDNHMTLWANEIHKRWPDVKHCFLEIPSRERERYPKHEEPETSCTSRTASITSPDREPETSCIDLLSRP